MPGSHMGRLLCLENPAPIAATFALVETFKAEDALAAQTLLETLKADMEGLLTAHQDRLARVTILGPGGDAPGSDDVTIFVVHQWKVTCEGHSTHAQRTACREYPNLVTYKKK